MKLGDCKETASDIIMKSMIIYKTSGRESARDISHGN